MDFILQRFSDNRKSTIGLLFKKIQMGKDIELNLVAYTLEDEGREVKVKSETRIPAGYYELVINKADTPLTLKYRAKYNFFKYHIEIKNVPNFQGVYIHIGNSDLDSAGCVLIGDNVDNNSITDGGISNSTQCYTRFYNQVYAHLEAGRKAHIEIRDEDHLLK